MKSLMRVGQGALVLQKGAQEVLHPGGQGAQAVLQVLDDGRAVGGVGQDSAESPAQLRAVCRDAVLQSVQSLHHPHGWAARPVELAGRGLAEADAQGTQVERRQPGVGVHHHL